MSFLCFIGVCIFFVSSVKVIEFLLVTYPLEPISNGVRLVVQPAFTRSSFRSLYLLLFLKNADSMFFSKLHVSSKISIVFLLLSKNTKSGLSVVTKTSGGIVPPFRLKPGMSAYIVQLPPPFPWTNACARWLRIELCLQVNLPWSREVLHQLSVCSKLPKLLHWSHLSVFRIPHLLRLSGVFKPFTLLFIANDNMPRGTLLMMLFHVMLFFSSINKPIKSPWNVSF